MAAVMGGGVERYEAALRQGRGESHCSVANINSPSQVVIAGNTAAVNQAISC